LLHTTGQDPACRRTSQREPTGEPFGMAWGWGSGGLDFNAIQHTATVDDQVYLGASTRLPVVEPWVLAQLSTGFHPFTHHCSLCQGSEARALEDGLRGVETEEKGRQSRIEQIQLGALANPFAEVAVIRVQQIDDLARLQHRQPALDGRTTDTESRPRSGESQPR